MSTGRVSSSLHILSWNVASWITTAGHISRHHGSVSHWLDRHNVDILCLQEVKSTKQKLVQAVACHLNPTQWTTFLSPCVSPRPGFNGVATIVRKHRADGQVFPVMGASSRCFGISDLDDQGRCILTDHGAFVLVNVYVPYDGEKGVQVGLKLRFIEALKSLVLRIRNSGRSVICVGDFNVALAARDVHYAFRKIDLSRLLAVEEVEKSVFACETKLSYPANRDLVELVQYLHTNFESLRAILAERKVTPINSNNTTKYILQVGPKKTQIGPRQTSPGICEYTANLDAVLTEEGHVFKSAGIISVQDLVEVLTKCFGKTDISEQTIMAFSDLFGQPRSCPPVIHAFEEFLRACNLVDVYSAVNAGVSTISAERFTCWDQYRNERYENKGARIDYIYVDKSLAPSVTLTESPNATLSPLCVSSSRSQALQAATAEGRWKPVPFAGGGIDADHPSIGARDFEFIFTNPPHTGLVYTAPLYSDHIAVSCVLDMSKFPTEGLNERSLDSIGSAWKTSMADALVEATGPKTHSLKDMFAKVLKRKPSVVNLEDESDECNDVSKRKPQPD